MKKILSIALCIAFMGCGSTKTTPQCTKDSASPTGCQISRNNAHTTNFLASSLYYKKGQTGMPSEASKAVSEIVRFQKLYNATIHLMSHSLDETTAIQNKRLNTLINYLIQRGISADKIKKQTGELPLYRNGQKQTELSRRIEIYLEY